jgi:hypothetical protein
MQKLLRDGQSECGRAEEVEFLADNVPNLKQIIHFVIKENFTKSKNWNTFEKNNMK